VLGRERQFARAKVETLSPPEWKGEKMLIDSYSRKFKYLRLSLTEKCNFRCSYCLPNGFRGCSTTNYLNLNEIRNLAVVFKDLGIEKIRLTGGEPTLRGDLAQVIRTLKVDVGINQVALTTNGYRLEQDIEKLKLAGLDSLNISLDSLEENKFKEICGADKCKSIKRSIDRALELGFKNVKTNCVLLKNLNDVEFFNFVEFAKTRAISIRFIELMRTGDNKNYFDQHYLPVGGFEKRLLAADWSLSSPSTTSGPAKEYHHAESKGRIGFISPYSKDFCSTCNRLRVSSFGGLRLCLFGEGDMPLRHLLQNQGDQAQLKEKIILSLGLKTSGHRLHENIYGNMHSLSAIGG
jgi:cyclic pyranopterin phosphate synthase